MWAQGYTDIGGLPTGCLQDPYKQQAPCRGPCIAYYTTAALSSCAGWSLTAPHPIPRAVCCTYDFQLTVSDAGTNDSDSVVVPCSPRLTHLTTHGSVFPTCSPSLRAHLHSLPAALRGSDYTHSPQGHVSTREGRPSTSLTMTRARSTSFLTALHRGGHSRSTPLAKSPGHPQTRARQKMMTPSISTICRHGERYNVNVSLHHDAASPSKLTSGFG